MLPLNANLQIINSGKWWINKSDLEKSEFLSGYTHATSTLHEYYSQRKIMEAETSADSLIAGILKNYDKKALGMISNISADLIIMELNDFYLNPLNQSIEFRYALVIVKMKLENESYKAIRDKLWELRN